MYNKTLIQIPGNPGSQMHWKPGSILEDLEGSVLQMSSINHIFVYMKYKEKKIIWRGKVSFDMGILILTSLRSPSHTLKYKGRLDNIRGRVKKSAITQQKHV